MKEIFANLVDFWKDFWSLSTVRIPRELIHFFYFSLKMIAIFTINQ